MSSPTVRTSDWLVGVEWDMPAISLCLCYEHLSDWQRGHTSRDSDGIAGLLIPAQVAQVQQWGRRTTGSEPRPGGRRRAGGGAPTGSEPPAIAGGHDSADPRGVRR